MGHVRLNQPYFIILCILFFSELWLSEFWFTICSNIQHTSVTTLTPTVNLLLTNALNKYHPFMFYTSVYLVLTYFYTVAKFELENESSTFNTKFSYSSFLLKLALTINFISLLWGSWWALQEGTWGGWWNWDSSELFGLLPSLIVLQLIHHKATHLDNWKVISKVKEFIIILIILYSLIQLNFEIISHNFGPKFFFFFNSNLSSVILLSLTCILLILNVKEYTYLSTEVFPTNGLFLRSPTYISQTSYTTVTTHSVIMLWLILGFSDFFESIVYSLFTFNYTTTKFFSLLNNLLLLVFLVTFTVKWRDRFWTSSLIWPSYLFYSRNLRYPTSYLHLTLLSFLILALLTSTLSIFTWTLSAWSADYASYTGTLFRSSYTFTCDSWSVDKTTLWFDNCGPSVLSWVTRDIANIESLNTFTLVLLPDMMINLYHLTSLNLIVEIIMTLPFLTTLPILSLMTIAFFQSYPR